MMDKYHCLISILVFYHFLLNATEQVSSFIPYFRCIPSQEITVDYKTDHMEKEQELQKKNVQQYLKIAKPSWDEIEGNMKEKWIKWNPIEGLSEKYYVESIIDSIEGFRIIFFDSKNHSKKVMISFPNSIDAYRRTNETFTFLRIDSLSERYGSQFYGEWTFFKIENSEYLKWISEQSYHISESRDFTHFCFLAVDSIVDIITDYEPAVTLITQ